MQVDHGGFQLGMAHISLDDAQVDPGLQKVSGVGMPQGVNRYAAFVDAGLGFGLAKSALDTGFCHGRLRGGRGFAVSSERREY